jgi:hypothetical protein
MAVSLSALRTGCPSPPRKFSDNLSCYMLTRPLSFPSFPFFPASYPSAFLLLFGVFLHFLSSFFLLFLFPFILCNMMYLNYILTQSPLTFPYNQPRIVEYENKEIFQKFLPKIIYRINSRLLASNGSFLVQNGRQHTPIEMSVMRHRQ